jgi:hypothetical protein
MRRSVQSVGASKTMSSVRRHDTQFLRALPVAFAFLLAIAITLVFGSSTVDASKAGSAASKSKLPSVTSVTPLEDILVGQSITIKGKNFVKGKKALVVIFKRPGSSRQFTARGDASSTTKATVVVPNVTSDLVPIIKVLPGQKDNMFRLRLVTKYGASKKWTVTGNSPVIKQIAGVTPTVDPGATGDCDSDSIKNAVDLDDDGDLLDDVTELSIGTDTCKQDTDGDTISDYYEWRVAYEYNGGPVLPYPGLRPYPNPLLGSDAGKDYDGDRMTQLNEYRAWQYTKQMTRFYSDADQDSDGDGKMDGAEDEDHDLLPNLVELGPFDTLNWLRTDTDGDGLCDGLDDEDHDGPPTAVADGDCNVPVPNNGPNAGWPATGLPPTDPADSGTIPVGDPGPKVDGDDNQYSNFYEWYEGGGLESSVGGAYSPCYPSDWPVSPYCPSDFNPLPTPDP